MSWPRWASFRPVAPAHWSDVSPEWMTEAIRSRHPDAVVSRVTLLSRDDGTNRRARFALEYAQGGGPRGVFVKAHAAAHRWVHLRNGNLFNEARLFAVGTQLPCEHPLVYSAVPDYPRLDFLLVMEDLTLRGADPLDSLRPMNLAQVTSGLAGLAALHREYWGMTARCHKHLGWLREWSPSQGWQVGLRHRVPIGLSRYQPALPAPLAGMDGTAIVDRWVRYVETLADTPHTLLHGDAHIGNTYVLPGDETGFLDWQVVRRGHWSQDVGYFLIGALTVEDRRRHERQLLEVYRESLDLPEGQAPGAEEVWQRYRLSPAYGLAIWLSTLGTDGWQRHEISAALAERYAAAYADLETERALMP